MSYMTIASVRDLPFCPGCGHTQILPKLDEALAMCEIDPKRLVIVTDIGCVGLSDQYFATHAFHGLHGRAVTYATGMKLARPELEIVVLIGDGGCGIGGTHLISAARRNIGMTVLVFNNFNYGMTGGEHSVTTPHGAITADTPAGNLEAPLDICETLAPARPSFLARTTTFDRNLPQLIAEAIKRPGFSLVDIWEYCTAYYVPRNDLNKQGLLDIFTTNGFRKGVIYQGEREEFSLAYRKQNSGDSKPARRSELKVEFRHSLERKIGLILAGAAGQKVKSTATVFGRAAIMAGLHVTQKDDYPITIMTGHSISELILSPESILYTGIDAPDHMIVISSEGLEKSQRSIERMRPDALLFIDSDLPEPKTAARVVAVPFKKMAQSVDRYATATVALAAFLEATGIMPVAALERAISSSQRGPIAEVNLKACAAGKELAALMR